MYVLNFIYALCVICMYVVCVVLNAAVDLTAHLLTQEVHVHVHVWLVILITCMPLVGCT